MRVFPGEPLRRARLARYGAALVVLVAMVVAVVLLAATMAGVNEAGGQAAEAGPTSPPATSSPVRAPRTAPPTTGPVAGRTTPRGVSSSRFICQGTPLAFVSASPAGGFVLTCADGSQRFADQSGPGQLIESDPSFSPDGTLMAFVRRPEHLDFGAVVVAGVRGMLDLSVDVGQDPAFGPGSALAYIDDVAGDGRQPRIAVRPKIGEYAHGRRFPDEAERAFPATTESGGAQELTARSLTWDASGERLWWEAGYDGFDLYTAELTGARTVPRRVVAGPQAERLLAPATAGPGTAAVIHQRGGVDGASTGTLEFGLVALTGRVTAGEAEAVFTPVRDLDELPAPLHPLLGRLFMTAAGTIAVERSRGVPFRVVPGDAPAWVVGDGSETYLVDANGKIADLRSSWTGVAVNPAVGGVRR